MLPHLLTIIVHFTHPDNQTRKECILSAATMPLCYEPLESSSRQIRLLELLPSIDGQVNGRLHIASLDDQPVFNALSYVWGVEEDPKTITINGEAIKAKKNLRAALLRLQDSDSQAIWIDAICIDQENIDEKNSQLPLMRAIYTQALRVIIWLGEGNKYLDALFQWVEHLEVAKADRSEASSTATLTNLKGSEKAFISYIDFFFLPYWQRMWTFQELALSRNDPICLYGGYRGGLSILANEQEQEQKDDEEEREEGELLFHRRKHILEAELARLDPIVYGAGNTTHIPGALKSAQVLGVRFGIKKALAYSNIDGNDEDLFILLHATIGRKCHDPRDRIYALQGLSESFRMTYPADYGKNNPVENVLVSAALWMLEHEEDGNDGSLFRFFGMRSSRFSDNLALPSWIPDFDSLCLHPILEVMARSLQYRSAHDPRPATHDRDTVILLGRPGVGVVAAGESSHTAIPASFQQFVDILIADARNEPLEPKEWKIVQLPAWKHEPFRAVEQSWDEGPVSDTPTASSFHVGLSILGDMPPLRMSGRNFGQCRLVYSFGSDPVENGFLVALILWGSRWDLDSWSMTLQTLDSVHNCEQRNFYDSVADTAILQTLACYELLTGFKDANEFWAEVGSYYIDIATDYPADNYPSNDDLTDDYPVDYDLPDESLDIDHRIKGELSIFMVRCATRMRGMSAFWVDIQDERCLGVSAENVRKDDTVFLPLHPYLHPIVLRREEYTTVDYREPSQEIPLHGMWNDLIYYRMVGPAYLQDLVDETHLVAEIANQKVEDFYIR